MNERRTAHTLAFAGLLLALVQRDHVLAHLQTHIDRARQLPDRICPTIDTIAYGGWIIGHTLLSHLRATTCR